MELRPPNTNNTVPETTEEFLKNQGLSTGGLISANIDRKKTIAIEKSSASSQAVNQSIRDAVAQGVQAPNRNSYTFISTFIRIDCTPLYRGTSRTPHKTRLTIKLEPLEPLTGYRLAPGFNRTFPVGGILRVWTTGSDGKRVEIGSTDTGVTAGNVYGGNGTFVFEDRVYRGLGNNYIVEYTGETPREVNGVYSQYWYFAPATKSSLDRRQN